MSASNILQELELELEYPSHIIAPNFVTVKLSGGDKYDVWKTQMLCLLESHGMLGFINDGNATPHKSWTRSDALVKGWILGSLSEEAAVCVVKFLSPDNFTAKQVWEKVAKLYGPKTINIVVQQPHAAAEHDSKAKGRPAVDDQERERNYNIHQHLYVALERERWKVIEYILKTKQVKITDRLSISMNGNTALHLAVAYHTVKNKFLERMLEYLELEGEESSRSSRVLLNVRNSDGITLLHLAATLGNTDAARILVERNRDLLFAKDNKGSTPLDIFPSRPKNNETYLYLLDCSTMPDPEQGTGSVHRLTDEKPLINAISCKDFELACKLVERYNELKSGDVLMAIAEHAPNEFGILQMIIYALWETPILRFASRAALGYEVRSILDLKFMALAKVVLGVAFLWPLQMLIWSCMKSKVPVISNYKKIGETREAVGQLLKKVCGLMKDSSNDHYLEPLFVAMRRGACDVVEHIVFWFPNATRSVDEDGHNIAQAALKNRSTKVLALITHGRLAKPTLIMSRNPCEANSCGNNVLHFAARLAPDTKLSRISSAALQIRYELQWFRMAKRWLPLCIKGKNCVGETPEMVFTREHKELSDKGEKWLKDTANSGIVTATLLTTITFAAAITVPGGNDDEKGGIPHFEKHTLFTLFAVPNAVSMFTSATSLLLFLSIFTSAFGEKDFALHLYLRLLSAFATLFLSVTFMIAAFGATLSLMFGQPHPLMVYLMILPLTLLPISCFALYLNSLIKLRPYISVFLIQRLRLVGRLFI